MENSIKFVIPTTKVIGDMFDILEGDEVTIREGDSIERFKVLGIESNKLKLARINREATTP